MNKNELQAEMKRKGFTYKTMSEAIGISANGFWRKINGENDFTLSEIQSIAALLDLNNEQVRVIFLDIS